VLPHQFLDGLCKKILGNTNPGYTTQRKRVRKRETEREKARKRERERERERMRESARNRERERENMSRRELLSDSGRVW
jgi:hypothetical protein